MTVQDRFCSSCRHFKPGFDECMRNAYDEVDVVTGKIKVKNGKSVFVERGSGLIESWLFGQCGKRGRFWQPAFIRKRVNS